MPALESELSEPHLIVRQPNNLTASRLGTIAHETTKAPGGDSIDTGLILLRRLEEKGFKVIMTASAYEASK